jgi:hypothetical protein
VLLGPHVQQQLQITGEILDRKKQLKFWIGEEFRSKLVLCVPRVRRELGMETKQRTATGLLPRPFARSLELCNADLPFPSHLLPLSLSLLREREDCRQISSKSLLSLPRAPQFSFSSSISARPRTN